MLKLNEYHCLLIIEFGVLMITEAHVVKQNKLNHHTQRSKYIMHTVECLLCVCMKIITSQQHSTLRSLINILEMTPDPWPFFSCWVWQQH